MTPWANSGTICRPDRGSPRTLRRTAPPPPKLGGEMLPGHRVEKDTARDGDAHTRHTTQGRGGQPRIDEPSDGLGDEFLRRNRMILQCHRRERRCEGVAPRSATPGRSRSRKASRHNKPRDRHRCVETRGKARVHTDVQKRERGRRRSPGSTQMCGSEEGSLFTTDVARRGSERLHRCAEIAQSILMYRKPMEKRTQRKRET